MGDYKDKHGKTRVGNFLKGIKNVAPDVLNLAGNITGVNSLNKLGDAIKGDTGISDEDKETALALLNLDIQEMKDVTERWKADMVSDSWLSKNVRPMTIVYLTFFMTLMIVGDSFEAVPFEVKDVYVKLLEALLVTVYIAYFGSRGVEKYTKLRRR